MVVLIEDVRFAALGRGFVDDAFDLTGVPPLLPFRRALLAGVAVFFLERGAVLGLWLVWEGDVVRDRDGCSLSDSACASMSESDSSREFGVGSCVGSAFTIDTRDCRRECDWLPGPL